MYEGAKICVVTYLVDDVNGNVGVVLVKGKPYPSMHCLFSFAS